MVIAMGWGPGCDKSVGVGLDLCFNFVILRLAGCFFVIFTEYSACITIFRDNRSRDRKEDSARSSEDESRRII